jgi:hypothetical protein
MGTYHLRALDASRGIARVFVYSAWSIAWFVAPAAMDKLKRLHPRIRETSFRAFCTHERFRSHLFSKRKMKILFSRKEGWEQPIKDGFLNTPHEIAFEDFTPPNIKDYDLIVPLTLRDLKYLSKVRNLIIDNPIPIPSMESIVLCHDKYLLNQLLAANGFEPFIPKMGRPLTYPYILKKRIDEGGRNSHVISDARQEQIFSGTLTDSEYFFQDLIKGPYEYATHILFKNQRIMHSLNIEYKFNAEMPIKGKDKPIYSMICHCPYLDVFAAMLTCIGFDGLCCVNYKVSDNHPFLLEINPRFGGSLSRYFFSFIRHTA